jgi:dihydropteroate synthase
MFCFPNASLLRESHSLRPTHFTMLYVTVYLASDIPISIDTRRSVVADAAIEAGADIVNDVSGGTFDPELFAIVAKHQVPVVIMHMRGTPQTMAKLTNYDNNEQGGVVANVANALMERSTAASVAGIPKWLQIVDPGIGFAKDFEDNLTLLKHFDTFREVVRNYPLLIGPSRKRFIGTITGEKNPIERDSGTIAACLACLSPSSVGDGTLVRVHNVKAVKQACQVIDAIHATK